MLWITSPACTELEMQIMDWLVEMLDLPRAFHSSSSGGGVIEDSASSSSLCALLAARERATGLQSNAAGLRGIDQRLVAYTSTQAHSSIEKAMKVAGLGSDNLRLIAVDENFAMRPDALQAQIDADSAAGLLPFFVCATVGTTSSTAIDPLEAIGPICREQGLWLHVDSAMLGTAALCPEYRWIHAGLEYADSYVFNPHKWMFTNFDCSCFFVADRSALIAALSVLPEYLRNAASADGAVVDYRDWQVPLGRRFRSLKLWFVIRHYGVEGLQFHVRNHVAIAQEFVRWVEQDPAFELAAPAPLNHICFRLRACDGEGSAETDARNEALLNRLNGSGALYMTHTRLDGRYTLRLCVGQSHTTLEHLRAAWDAIRSTATDLRTTDLGVGDTRDPS
jgi:aromatic-L-amino-acid decarboxylase